MRLVAAALIATLSISARAKETVRIAFVGPLTGGNSAIGLGGRNSADLAVKLRNADAKAKYQYELLVLDDECKPDAGVQMATKAGSDRTIVGGVTHYCSVVAMATVDTFHKFGLPTIVWGAVLPDITYAHDYKEIHRVNGTMINQNETAAKFMVDQGFKTWSVIHDTTDYGKGHNKYFSKSGGALDGHHRQSGSQPARHHRRAGQGEGPRFDHRPRHLRRSRPEQRGHHHQVRGAGRQVGRLGGQRVRRRKAQDEGEVMSAGLF